MPVLDAVIIGKIHLPEIGGGPIVPPTQPPGIWPSPGVPTHPIYYPPVISGPPGPWPTPPIYLPPTLPGIWPSPGHPAHPIYYPPVISGPPGPWPTPPIYLPQPPEKPTEPPSTDGKWAYSPIYGWVWVPADSGGKPTPP